MPAGEPIKAAREAPPALSLAEMLHDHERALAACLLAIEGLWRYGQATMAAGSEYTAWTARADSTRLRERTGSCQAGRPGPVANGDAWKWMRDAARHLNDRGYCAGSSEHDAANAPI
jgi:hypothetical protein